MSCSAGIWSERIHIWPDDGAREKIKGYYSFSTGDQICLRDMYDTYFLSKRLYHHTTPNWEKTSPLQRCVICVAPVSQVAVLLCVCAEQCIDFSFYLQRCF